jgi:uncharacterized membrane protein
MEWIGLLEKTPRLVEKVGESVCFIQWFQLWKRPETGRETQMNAQDE